MVLAETNVFIEPGIDGVLNAVYYTSRNMSWLLLEKSYIENEHGARPFPSLHMNMHVYWRIDTRKL